MKHYPGANLRDYHYKSYNVQHLRDVSALSSLK